MYLVAIGSEAVFWAREIPGLLFGPEESQKKARAALGRELTLGPWTVAAKHPGGQSTVAEGTGEIALWRMVLSLPQLRPGRGAPLPPGEGWEDPGGPSLYVASSWKNAAYGALVDELEGEGYGVLDWRGVDPFSWADVDPAWEAWGKGAYLEAMATAQVQAFAAKDLRMMHQAAACVLLLPCGRSAHLEAGWFCGQGKPVYVLLGEGDLVPELMYHVTTAILPTAEALLTRLRLDMPTERYVQRMVGRGLASRSPRATKGRSVRGKG